MGGAEAPACLLPKQGCYPAGFLSRASVGGAGARAVRVVWVPSPFLWLSRAPHHSSRPAVPPAPPSEASWPPFCYPCRSNGLLWAGTNKEWILNLVSLGLLPCLLARLDLISPYSYHTTALCILDPLAWLDPKVTWSLACSRNIFPLNP